MVFQAGTLQIEKVKTKNGEFVEYIWEYAVVPYHTYEQVSFVNGNSTNNGGKHVDYIVYQIINKLKKRLFRSLFSFGDPDRTLTCGLIIRSDLLYTTELQGHKLVVLEGLKPSTSRFVAECSIQLS